MVLNDAECPRLRELFQQGLQLSCDGFTDAQRAVIAAVEAAGWYVEEDCWKLITYRDWFACRRAADKPIPEEVAAIAAELDAATAKQMRHIFEGGAEFTQDPVGTRTEALRLAIGRFWSHIVDGLSRPDGGLHLYSGHDWTVSPLLLCITRHDDPLHEQWPPFCSNIAFELWSTREAECGTPRHVSYFSSRGTAASDDEHFVRVLYNGDPVRLACGSVTDQPGTCTLAEFKELVAPFCVQDFATESQPRKTANTKATNSGFNSQKQ